MQFWLPFTLLPKVKLSTAINRYFYKSIEQTSAGTITFYLEPDSKTPLYLQIYRSKDKTSGAWTFTKGRVETQDNSIQDRALQETKEESGLEVTILTYLGENHYKLFIDDSKLFINKTVKYYLAKSSSQDVSFTRFNKDISEIEEAKEFRWSPIDVAIKNTAHKTEKDLLIQANNWIVNNYLGKA